jgi:hypothetical protein
MRTGCVLSPTARSVCAPPPLLQEPAPCRHAGPAQDVGQRPVLMPACVRWGGGGHGWLVVPAAVPQDGKGDDCDIDDDNDGKVGPFPACVASHWWLSITAHMFSCFLFLGLIPYASQEHRVPLSTSWGRAGERMGRLG